MEIDLPPPPVFTPARLKALRETLNVTQTGLAALVGVSVRLVEVWERAADPRPPSAGICRLLQLLELDEGKLGRSLTRGVMGRNIRG
jgi:DNA-binding transcriptional regulator YiaG